MVRYPSKRNFPFPQCAAAWLTCKVYGWLGVKLCADALFTVMVAGVAYLWWLGVQRPAIYGDDGGLGVSQFQLLLITVKNLPSRLYSMVAGGLPSVICWAIS